MIADPTADLKTRLPDAETEFSPCAELMHCAAYSTFSVAQDFQHLAVKNGDPSTSCWRR